MSLLCVAFVSDQNNAFNSYAQLLNTLRTCASKRGVQYSGEEIIARHARLLAGFDEIRHTGFKRLLTGTKGYGIVEASEAHRYMEEAGTLMAIGEWQKAYEIFWRFWIPGSEIQFSSSAGVIVPRA